jgi:radical SAM superfamily enzyme YgiQ (UPF0313 family)
MVLDEMFTFNPRHAISIAEVISIEIFFWECTTRADLLQKDVTEALANSNCIEVKLGLESGSQNMLNRMNKRLDLNKAKRSIIIASSQGLPIKLFLMHGFPGEDEETTQETINFLIDLKSSLSRVTLFRFTPVPGSPIYSSSETVHNDWNDYTIYENNRKWWGSNEDFQVVNNSFYRLRDAVIELFGKIN